MKSKIFFFFSITFFLLVFNFQNSYSQMFWNQAASIAGNSTSYISVPNSASTNVIGSFTIEVWVNPTSVTGSAKGIISKGGLLGTSLKYSLRISNGRLSMFTNGAQRLITKSSTLINVNAWTHITATYSSTSNQFKIYINGNLDSSSTVAGAAPTTNTDSLFIGISGSSTPFAGQMDEVRIWSRELTSAEAFQYSRSSVAEVSGVYSGLILSMTFQDENSLGTDFNTRDISGNGNNGNARNIAAVDQSNVPYTTIHNNESVFLNGSNNYLTGKDTSALDASIAITIECWVYSTSNSVCSYISKGAATRVYFLGWDGTKVIAKINNTALNVGSAVVPLNQWTHLALVYKNSGPYNLFLNGKGQFAGFSALGNISNSTDSLYIGGGSGSLTEMTGYIDEVRISKDHYKSNYEVLTSMYNSVDAGNDPDPVLTNISYNFDGLLVDNANNGGPKLKFIGNAMFSHPAGFINPVSPLTRDKSESFSKGYYIKKSSKSISQAGDETLSGTTFDTLTINQNVTMSDVNLFVAINHGETSQLDIVLIAPNGDSVNVFNNSDAVSNNQGLVTLFDDQADSSLSNSRFTTFSPLFKPANSMNSVFSGDRSQGKWIIKITDNNLSTIGTSPGTLYAWGFQLNNQTETKLNLNIGAIMQGFYDPATNIMKRDTMKVYFREQTGPFTIIDSSIAFLDSTGLGLFAINAHLLQTGVQVQLKHRNSIETWASGIGIFLQNSDIEYRFSDFSSRAFGDNEIQIDDNPFRVAIFSGDVNQNRIIDLTDVLIIYNDANIFATGYKVTDITGDNLTDLNDIIIAFNNSNNFVTAIIP